MKNLIRISTFFVFFVFNALFFVPIAKASEADINLPDLTNIYFSLFGSNVSGIAILNVGLLICIIGLFFGLIQYRQTKNLPAHTSMLSVSNTIWETCKTYLTQQGKFLLGLWILIALCMIYYFSIYKAHPF